MYQSKDSADTREIKRGEIYFIDLSGVDYTDSHITGKNRPGLIIQNDVGNENSYNVIVALLTSTDKRPYPFQYKVDLNGRLSTIMFDQIITLSRQNLDNKVGEITPQQMREADVALMCSLSLEPYSMPSVKDFNVTHMITERTKNTEATRCVVEILYLIGDKDNMVSGEIDLSDLSQFDPSITKYIDLDEIKSKLNNCAGLNFMYNHIVF